MLSTENILTVAVLSVLALIGCTGNILALYVYLKSGRLKTSMFIVALACTDLTASLLTIPFTMVMEAVHFHVKGDAMCKIYHFILSTTTPFSAMTMVAISTERYVCVCKSSSNLITKFRTRLTISLIALGSTVLGSLSCLNYGTLTIVSVHDLSNLNLLESFFNESQFAVVGDDLRTSTSIAHNLKSTLNDETLLEHFSHGKEMVSHNSSNSNLLRTTDIHEVNSELCHNNAIVLGMTFQKYFTAIYSGVFALCCLVMVITYVKLFLFLHRHRERQRKRRQSRESAQFMQIKEVSWSVAFSAEDKPKNRRTSTHSQLCPVEESESLRKNDDLSIRFKGRRRSTGQTNITQNNHIRRYSQFNAPTSTSFRVASVQESSSESFTTSIASNDLIVTQPNLRCHSSVALSNSSISNTKKRRQSMRRRLLKNSSNASLRTELSYGDVTFNRYRRKNLKTALCLSLIALVFVASFLPAWLMKFNVIPFNMVVFNLYFVHSVADPFIYAFLNPEFRKEMKRLKLCN